MDDYERNTFNENNDFTDSQKNTDNNVNFILPSIEQPKPKPKKKSKRKLILSYISIALVSALIGGLSSGYVVASQFSNSVNSGSDKSASLTAQDVNINLTDNVYFAEAVAQKAQRTVVGITSDVTKQVNTFFGPQIQKGQSMGSGFIINSNGYIITNAHVIGDGKYENIKVSLIDGSNEEGKVLWYDTTLDLAIVKINKTGLPVADLGDSDDLNIGEPAVAIGNPMTLDLDRTVTQGIISGLNRSIAFDDGSVMEPLIQTDASINAGNSGGPLFNAEGKVVGINTAKMSSAEGLGFAIPINTAKPIIDQIIKTGTFSTVYLGIKGVDVETYERALGIDLSADSGVVVVETIKNSPAVAVGLKSGDVITSIDGVKIESMSDLKRRLYKYKENDKVELTILRSGDEQNLQILLKEKPENY